MKKAFTLAEVMITMSIIGIVAAFTIPTISHIRPDQNKARYLQAFDALQRSVLSYASNPDIYPTDTCDSNNQHVFSGIDANGDPINAPLLNLGDRNGDNTFMTINGIDGDNRKLCELLAWGMNVDTNNVSCSQDINSANPMGRTGSIDNNNASFTSPNGINFLITLDSFSLDNANSTFSTNVIIDVNRDDDPNCSYYGPNDNRPHNAQCDTHPDQFWFMITGDGKVIPADPMGKMYVRTRTTLTRKNDTPQINNIENVYTTWKNDGAGHTNIQIDKRISVGSCTPANNP